MSLVDIILLSIVFIPSLVLVCPQVFGIKVLPCIGEISITVI